MIKKILLFSCLSFGILFLTNSAWAQSPNQRAKMILGNCQRSDLESNQQFSTAYRLHYDEYTVDNTQTKALSKTLENINVHIVFGTWCGDSKLQVSRFLKIIDAVSFPEKSISFEGVDYTKKTTKDLQIEKVPTFIFYKDGREIYRMVEKPEVSLELDMLAHIQ